MKSFLQTIEEALLRTPAFKTKICKMQNEFEDVFGNKLYSKKFDYDIKMDDLIQIFNLANKWFFKSKLDIDSVSIIVIENSIGHKDKGSFKLGVNANGKHLIGIVKYIKDNFYQVVNVLLHEMIHLYDSKFGPLKDEAGVTVGNSYGKQYVKDYDVHGKYFKTWCQTINAYGFDVQEKYSISGKRAMKKVIEQENASNVFFDDVNPNDIAEYLRVKAMYDRLKNCNKDMVFRDAKHWYIQID